MERILLAYDGSDPAKKALAMAADLAKHYTATVTVVSVVPVQAGRAPIAPWDDGEVHTAELQEAAKLLREQGIEPKLVRPSGHPAETIEEIAKEGHFDVIVLGSRGSNILERVMLGSVSEHVATHADTAVLIAR